MKVSFIGSLIGNSGLLQKERLNGSTTQMVESRQGGKKAQISTKLQQVLCCHDTDGL